MKLTYSKKSNVFSGLFGAQGESRTHIGVYILKLFLFLRADSHVYLGQSMHGEDYKQGNVYQMCANF